MKTQWVWWSPAHDAPPSVPVRRVGPALLIGALVGVVCFLGCAWGSWTLLDGLAPWNDGCGRWCWHPGPWEVISYLPWDPWDQPLAVYSRTAPGAVIGLLFGGLIARSLLRPYEALRHVSGPRLLAGEDAERRAAEMSCNGGYGLPPLRFPRETLTRGVLIAGSVGSGKTQLTMRLLTSLNHRRVRSLVLDVKGDFTSTFPSAALLHPWDARSRAWDVAADVRSVSDAQAFASVIAPAQDGDAKHWDTTAQGVIAGAVVYLQHEFGRAWGWRELDGVLALGLPDLARILADHYPQAVGLLGAGDARTQASVRAAVTAHTRVISDLARAWGGGERKKVSLRAWAADDYRGRRMIILGAGPDPVLTRLWLSAVVSTASAALLALPDSRARTVAVVLDELPAVGRINIEGLFARGRSKGVCPIAGFQDIAQVREVYGANLAQALPSMVGTQLICQIGPGETREQVARWIGKRRVLVPALTRSIGKGESMSHGAREEMRPLVEPADLGALGVIRRRDRFWVRALLHQGGDVLVLDFPGREWPVRCPPFMPADWTLH
jgi:hypothetical protein